MLVPWTPRQRQDVGWKLCLADLEHQQPTTAFGGDKGLAGYHPVVVDDGRAVGEQWSVLAKPDDRSAQRSQRHDPLARSHLC